MSTYLHSSNRDCPTPTKNPAAQPQAPKDCDQGSSYHSKAQAPDLKEPEIHKNPDPCCKCPTASQTDSVKCLEDEIAKQSEQIDAAEKAKAFKAELVVLLESAKKASLGYTPDKYAELLKEWKRQDVEIAELVRKLVCAVPCWHCILDCHVCPLLNELVYAEKILDSRELYTSLHDLQDKRYWYSRDVATKQRNFDRVSSVLGSWKDPAKTISDALVANKTLTDASSKIIGTEPGKALFDVFFRLIPLHLAIAPPQDATATTSIDQKFTMFCDCEKGCADTCCGPDVGERTFRQRFVGPQPYLIKPDAYLKLICCLVEHRYVPAQKDLSEARAQLAAVEADIKTYQDRTSVGWAKVFEAAAKAHIPGVINCCDYDKHDD